MCVAVFSPSHLVPLEVFTSCWHVWNRHFTGPIFCWSGPVDPAGSQSPSVCPGPGRQAATLVEAARGVMLCLHLTTSYAMGVPLLTYCFSTRFRPLLFQPALLCAMCSHLRIVFVLLDNKRRLRIAEPLECQDWQKKKKRSVCLFFPEIVIIAYLFDSWISKVYLHYIGTIYTKPYLSKISRQQSLFKVKTFKFKLCSRKAIVNRLLENFRITVMSK